MVNRRFALVADTGLVVAAGTFVHIAVAQDTDRIDSRDQGG